MKKYEFRLEAVRRLRITSRDQRRAALAEAYRAEQVLGELRAELEAEQAALLQSRQAAASERVLNMNSLLEAQRYELVLRRRDLELRAQEELLAAEVRKRREALVEADREVRVLELLDQRQRKLHRRQQQRLETRQLDEVAMTKYQRS